MTLRQKPNREPVTRRYALRREAVLVALITGIALIAGGVIEGSFDILKTIIPEGESAVETLLQEQVLDYKKTLTENESELTELRTILIETENDLARARVELSKTESLQREVDQLVNDIDVYKSEVWEFLVDRLSAGGASPAPAHE